MPAQAAAAPVPAQLTPAAGVEEFQFLPAAEGKTLKLRAFQPAALAIEIGQRPALALLAGRMETALVVAGLALYPFQGQLIAAGLGGAVHQRQRDVEANADRPPQNRQRGRGEHHGEHHGEQEGCGGGHGAGAREGLEPLLWQNCQGRTVMAAQSWRPLSCHHTSWQPTQGSPFKAAPPGPAAAAAAR